MLSEPTGDERVDPATLAYFQVRNRGRLYDLVLHEFEKSGISQATLARRLGKRPELVSRFLASPGNWENDSVSDYLFAISGGEPAYSTAHPLREAPRNYTQPEWVVTGGGSTAIGQIVRFDSSAWTEANASAGAITSRLTAADTLGR